MAYAHNEPKKLNEALKRMFPKQGAPSEGYQEMMADIGVEQQGEEATEKPGTLVPAWWEDSPAYSRNQ